MTPRTLLPALLVVPLFVPACAEVVEPDVDIAQSALSGPVQNTDIHRSLVVTLNTPAERARFNFARVMTRLRATGGGSAVDSFRTNTLLFQQWMGTYGDGPGGCREPEIDPHHYRLDCPRGGEAALASFDPFAPNAAFTFEPIALFNRFDLAPINGSHCGEYRIVFAKFPNDTGGRALFSFEGALPNPRPALGRAACLPVARFWQRLSNDPDPDSRLAKLERFFFTGTAVPGFAPVVDARHYGLPGSTAGSGPRPGQIRANMFFIEDWNLREFKLNWRSCGAKNPRKCGVRFEHVTVKNNPGDELFAGNHPLSPAFRIAFMNVVPDLIATDINAIAMPTDDQFNEYESVPQARLVNYGDPDIADVTIRFMIQDRLRELGSDLGSRVVLHRATTQTCAGCHALSSGQNIGPTNGVDPPLIWPPSARYVHVNERATPIALSPALEDVFLPHRRDVLERFINAHYGYEPQDVMNDRPGLTIGGSHEGSPN